MTVTWPAADIAPPFSLAALLETVEEATNTWPAADIAPPLPVAVLLLSDEPVTDTVPPALIAPPSDGVPRASLTAELPEMSEFSTRTSPGVETAAPLDSASVLMILVFDKTTVGFTSAEPFSVTTVVVPTEIATPGLATNPDASCANSGSARRESRVTFSILTSVVALLAATPDWSATASKGLTAIKGSPEMISVPRSNVSKLRPSASVGAVIVIFVLISNVEFKIIVFVLVGLVVWLVLVTWPASLCIPNNSSLNPIVAEGSALKFAASTDLRRVQSWLPSGMSSSSDVTQ